jgi:cytochrome c-type biogenesis protein CcmH
MIALMWLVAAISVPDVSAVVGQPEQTPVSGKALNAQTEFLAGTIRCPVCQGSSVGDSPSEMARNMKQQVRELLSVGFSDEQIIRYFEASYGEFIRLEPRRQGFNLLVWAAPIVALVLGLIFFVLRLRRVEGLSVAHVPQANELPEDEALRPWVLKVRAELYGWPEGRPPDAKS